MICCSLEVFVSLCWTEIHMFVSLEHFSLFQWKQSLIHFSSIQLMLEIYLVRDLIITIIITSTFVQREIDNPQMRSELSEYKKNPYMGALKSRDLTTRHQIKQIATSWTSVGPRKNGTCWTISELNPVCHNSTAALTVACSFCVQSAIPSTVIRCPYTAAGRQQQQQQQQRGRRREQANFSGVGIGNGSRGNNLGRLLQSVHRVATCWLRTGAVRT